MKMPFSRRRIGAYHSVVASFVPWMRCQGRGGGSIPSAIPASTS
jgi:hypothetical protein